MVRDRKRRGREKRGEMASEKEERGEGVEVGRHCIHRIREYRRPLAVLFIRETNTIILIILQPNDKDSR